MIREYKKLQKAIAKAEEEIDNVSACLCARQTKFNCGPNFSIDLQDLTHAESYILFIASMIRSKAMAAKELKIKFTEWTEFKAAHANHVLLNELAAKNLAMGAELFKMEQLLTLEEKRKLFKEE